MWHRETSNMANQGDNKTLNGNGVNNPTYDDMSELSLEDKDKRNVLDAWEFSVNFYWMMTLIFNWFFSDFTNDAPKSKDKKKESTPLVSYFRLFRFATKFELFLVFIAIVCEYFTLDIELISQLEIWSESSEKIARKRALNTERNVWNISNWVLSNLILVVYN